MALDGVTFVVGFYSRTLVAGGHVLLELRSQPPSRKVQDGMVLDRVLKIDFYLACIGLNFDNGGGVVELA